MRLIIIVFVLFCFQTSFSQNITGIENFVLASEEDRTTLAHEYFSPMFNSFQISMSEGWVKTAKTHKKLGFDFTFMMSAINIPKSAQNFSTQNLGNISSSSSINPTIFGGESSGNYLVDYSPADSEHTFSTSFDAPNGHEDLLINNRLLLPNLQFSIGIPFKTDLIIRVMHETQTKGAKFNSYGLGIKHDILQYFKPAKVTPFNVSILANYSKLNGDYIIGSDSQLSGENQSILLEVDNTSAGLIVSADLKVVSFYASVSQVLSTSSFKVNGNYDLNYSSSISDNESVQITVTDPISIENKLDYLKKNVGVAFNFAFLNVFLDYSIQEFNSVNLGLSLGVR